MKAWTLGRVGKCVKGTAAVAVAAAAGAVAVVGKHSEPSGLEGQNEFSW